eukprot:scaffold70749_cov62-Phaeocystis_antarctica.AAC.8
MPPHVRVRVRDCEGGCRLTPPHVTPRVSVAPHAEPRPTPLQQPSLQQPAGRCLPAEEGRAAG